MPFSNCPGLTIGRRIQVGAPQTWYKVEEEPDVEKGESYSLKSQFHWIVLDFLHCHPLPAEPISNQRLGRHRLYQTRRLHCPY
ncbi:hypothetical protein BDQ94DRAFT_134235 [Aspergillus welwitschiae]|uniref:Uncharacterized protein n=1 Tax=Aspergillus welwitschiae TaxID=1341132 RepID=A0A3F3QIT0_9EURO|nr:hypothetical protein BDQ94DRAFT_134235 [Aspergillus welwitschiae]RDH38586.1 hypothetical protein BDQ94DRAFT_134235 [Aspergillus welwitschiae]